MIMVTTTKKAMRIPDINRNRFTYFITLNFTKHEKFHNFLFDGIFKPRGYRSGDIVHSSPCYAEKSLLRGRRLKSQRFLFRRFKG